MRFSAWSSDVCSSDLVYQVPPAYIELFTLRTSIPQALKVTVGGRDVGSIGPADTLVKGVSLKPVDLVARTAGSGAGIPAGPRPQGCPAAGQRAKLGRKRRPSGAGRRAARRMGLALPPMAAIW